MIKICDNIIYNYIIVRIVTHFKCLLNIIDNTKREVEINLFNATTCWENFTININIPRTCVYYLLKLT